MSDSEVCIIGAGAGGALAAWALVRRGVRVTLLDAGPRFNPGAFDTHAQRWELDASPFDTYASAERGWEGASGEPLDAAFRELSSHSPADPGSAPTQREPFVYSRALGVGGSTLHYQGEAHRFPAHAFQMRTERGIAADWPIDYEDLAPYYDRVERLLDVAGTARNPFKPARGPYPHPAHPLSRASQQVGEGARRLGWTLIPNSLAILGGPRDGRAACHFCNGCERGCRIGAKSSVDVAVLPEAERTGKLAIEPRVRVSRLEHGPDGRIRAVIGSHADGREVRFRARAFVLSAGAIESPRLLLHSAEGVHRNGIGNASGLVGRFLMETLYFERTGFLQRPVESYAGIPIESRIWDFNGARDDAVLPNGLVLGASCGVFQGPVGTALEGIAGYGREHRREMRRRFGAGITLFGIAEQLPRADNRVVLSERTDARGTPLARIETRLDTDDLRALSACRERLGELGEAAEVEFIGQVSAYDRPGATHVAGTCRMGIDPDTSVVDVEGVVHGVPNLIVADASVLVTEGAGDSPSLTIQALALRSAEALADRAQRGEI